MVTRAYPTKMNEFYNLKENYQSINVGTVAYKTDKRIFKKGVIYQSTLDKQKHCSRTYFENHRNQRFLQYLSTSGHNKDFSRK